jgi:hypothetical protein
MSKFLKLSALIINTSKIICVEIKPSKYILKISELNLSGSIFVGSGWIGSKPLTITICEKNNYQDFQTIKKWIDEN